MKWAKINGQHINTHAVNTFGWRRGVLYIWFMFEKEPVGFEDPTRESYIGLCHLIGVQPVEVE